MKSKAVLVIVACALVLAGFLTAPHAALADSTSVPTWWNGRSTCNGDTTAFLAATDTTLGLQICYPTPYDGQTQFDYPEAGAGTATLLEWECVELSARYLAEHKGMPNKGGVDGYEVARKYFGWYQSSHPELSMIYSNDTNNGIYSHPTTVGTFPSVGDVYSTSSGGSIHGHTGVVASVNITNAAAGNATLTIDQQNTDSGHSVSANSHDWPTGYLAINGWSYAQAAYDGGGPQSNVEILHFGAGNPPPPPTQLVAPTSVYDPINNETEFAARGASDNKMYFATQDGKQALNGGTWIVGWGSTPGATFAGNPIGVYDPNMKEIEFAARGTDGKMWFATQDATKVHSGSDWLVGWYASTSSGTFVGNPTVVYDGYNNQIEFAAHGTGDNLMYIATQDGTKTLNGNSWTVGWSAATGATLAGDPVGIYDAYPTNIEIEFAARGSDNKMWFVTQDATKPLNGASYIIGWYASTSSGTFVGNPTVVYDGYNNQIEFGAFDPNGSAYFATQDGAIQHTGSDWLAGWGYTPGGPFATTITS